MWYNISTINLCLNQSYSGLGMAKTPNEDTGPRVQQLFMMIENARHGRVRADDFHRGLALGVQTYGLKHPVYSDSNNVLSLTNSRPFFPVEGESVTFEVRDARKGKIAFHIKQEA